MNHKDPIDEILKRLSKKERKNVMQRMCKLQEECGELAVAVLRKHNLKHGGGTKENIHQNVLEEGCDVIIIALSILGAYKFTKQDVEDRMLVKMKKWEKIMKGYSNGRGR